MDLQTNGQQNTNAEEKEIYTFRREDGLWYIDLPAYLEHGWIKNDLQMAEGAHKFLNRIANGAKKVRLRLSTTPWDGAAVLQLVEHCDASRGGAIYLYLSGKGQPQSELFWICDLALFVFGDMPGHIYVQRLPAKNKQSNDNRCEGDFSNEKRPVYQRNNHLSSFLYHQIK